MTLLYLTDADLRAVKLRRLILGVSLGAALTLLGSHALAPAAPEPDPRMEVACQWPKQEGEMTVVTVLQGKVICWRWT